jgi:integrase
MSSLKVNEFMLNLSKDLVEKKKVAESTASAYIKSLYTLNNKSPFKNLTFIKNTDDIMKKIGEYADNTQKGILASITSVLSLYKDKPTYKKVYNFYYDAMMGKAKAMKENGRDPAEKTDKEKDNWVDWDEVKRKLSELQEDVAQFSSEKSITDDKFEKLLHYTILSLYTLIQPRRNQDYMDMYIVKKWKEDMPKDKNYLDIDPKAKSFRFIFNKFKTAKTYGTQIVEINDELENVLSMYIRNHPQFKSLKKSGDEIRFLVHSDGKPLTAVNAITRVLNKIFGRKIGSSMLRHIFLSSKYDIDEMSADASAMGHSLNEQKEYMRRKDDGDKKEDENIINVASS